jgi:hypothetical protein
MASSTGYVLTAGFVAASNDMFFGPKGVDLTNVNWRIVPATGIMALMLAGIGTVSPEFATGLGALVLLSVLIVPVGNAPTPLENLAKFVGSNKR